MRLAYNTVPLEKLVMTDTAPEGSPEGVPAEDNHHLEHTEEGEGEGK